MTYQNKLSVACVSSGAALWAVAAFLQYKPWWVALSVFSLGFCLGAALLLAISVLFSAARRLDDRKKP